jgi:SAM-dependent methyltransferase
MADNGGAMDYRKPVVFGRNWSPSRYRVLPYFAYEKPLIQQAQRVLDLGCANGWNMSRFGQYGAGNRQVGLEPNPTTVKLARVHGPVTQASGLELPFADATFDIIYVQHVLHHIGDVDRALAEIGRCLTPGGTLFLIETVEDNPIIRWGRRLYPNWMGDEINAPFRFTELRNQLSRHGFTVSHAEQYSVLFWLWETLPDQIDAMEKLTPAAVWVERQLNRAFNRYSAHCFYVARHGQ